MSDRPSERRGEARAALRTIRRCIGSDRVRVLPHFTRRMDERGMTWPDVLTVFDKPVEVRAAGADDWGRARWVVAGEAADGLELELVCVLDRGAAGELTVFITIYWDR